jgi:hypothetical protein
VDHVGDLFASEYYSGWLFRLHKSGGTWSIAAPIQGQPSASHWGEGFAEISDWRVGPDGALWYCRQATNFVSGTGSIGRVYGPGVTAVPPTAAAIASLELRFSPAVGRAEFAVRAPAAASLRVLDTAGRLVRRLEVGSPGASRTITWDGRDGQGRDASPGVYVASLDAGGQSIARRVVLLR